MQVFTFRQTRIKLKFSKSSFNFLQNRFIFYSLYPREYTAGDFAPDNPRRGFQWLEGLKGLTETLSDLETSAFR